MPDFTKCTNEDCPLTYSCWRFNAPATEYQYEQKFEPQIDEVLDEVECDFYIEKPDQYKSDAERLWA
jgi:hypothetical protein